MLFPLSWKPRLTPLAPSAVVAFDAVATRLARRVLQFDDAVLAQLRGVAGDGLIAVLGDADILPWADGVEYLGRSPDAPALLLPTCLEPDAGEALFERAIVRTPGGEPPLAISPARRRVLSVATARRLDRRRVSEWLARSVAP
jgi:hypothetical protein